MNTPEGAEPVPAPKPAPDNSSTDGTKSEAEQQRENNRSAVRMIVTYVAAGFLFIVGGAISGYLIGAGKIDDGKDVFLGILPVAAAVVTYWFATRQNDAAKPENLIKLIEAARGKNTS